MSRMYAFIAPLLRNSLQNAYIAPVSFLFRTLPVAQCLPLFITPEKRMSPRTFGASKIPSGLLAADVVLVGASTVSYLAPCPCPVASCIAAFLLCLTRLTSSIVAALAMMYAHQRQICRGAFNYLFHEPSYAYSIREIARTDSRLVANTCLRLQKKAFIGPVKGVCCRWIGSVGSASVILCNFRDALKEKSGLN